MIEYLKRCSLGYKLLFIAFFIMLLPSIMVGTSYYTMAFVALAVFIVPMRKYIDNCAIWLIIFSVLYSLMHIMLNLSLSHLPLYIFAPVVFYCFGSHLIDQFQNKNTLLSFLAITILCFSAVTYYTCIQDVINTGLINPYRIMGRVGGDEYDMAATLYGLNVSIGLVGLFVYLSINTEDRNKSHLLFVISFLLSLLTTVHLVNRTGLVLVAVAFIVYFFYVGKKTSSLSFGNVIVLVGIIVAGYYLLKSGDITSAYQSRTEIEGHNLSDAGNRTGKWMDALGRLFTDPLGWADSVSYTYVHNMWLDVARLTGIAPFIAIVVATIMSINRALKLYHHKGDVIVYTMLALYAVFFLESFMEPVIEGFELYFYLFCMIWGLISQYLKYDTLRWKSQEY